MITLTWHLAVGNANLTLMPTIPVAAIVSQARELWIEGEQQVGKLLVAKSYYFGGVEGNSEYWWLRITPDGDRADITEPTACDITKAVPSTDAPPGPGDADPRVHRLTEADLGCCVKVVCRPRRGDGETVSGVGGRRVRSACGVVCHRVLTVRGLCCHADCRATRQLRALPAPSNPAILRTWLPQLPPPQTPQHPRQRPAPTPVPLMPTLRVPVPRTGVIALCKARRPAEVRQ